MLRNADWSKWGPLTVLVVALTLIVVVFVAVYLIVTQPSTAATIGFLKALGEFAGATGLIGVAHGLLGRSAGLTAAPGAPLLDPVADRASADVSDETEFGAIPRPESAVRPDEPTLGGGPAQATPAA